TAIAVSTDRTLSMPALTRVIEVTFAFIGRRGGSPAVLWVWDRCSDHGVLLLRRSGSEECRPRARTYRLIIQSARGNVRNSRPCSIRDLGYEPGRAPGPLQSPCPDLLGVWQDPPTDGCRGEEASHAEGDGPISPSPSVCRCRQPCPVTGPAGT